MKFTGAAALGIAMLMGTLLIAGNPLEAQEAVPQNTLLENRIEAEDVLVEVSADAAQPATESEAQAAPQATAEVAASADQPLVIKRILPIDGPIKYGEWHWDDEGVPEGPLVVTVDLQARVISVFQDGYEIGAAAALLGTDEHPTPVGTFPILTKERHNVSEKYGNAPMPWTLRLTWDGVAIHGGSTVENGYASHGCIGVPDEFVSRLYAIAKKGDRVIITDGRRASIGTSLAAS